MKNKKIFFSFIILLTYLSTPKAYALKNYNLNEKITANQITSFTIRNKVNNNWQKTNVYDSTTDTKPYNTVQGFTNDDKYYYAVTTNDVDSWTNRYGDKEKHVSKIVKINMSTGKIENISQEIKIGHGNSLTIKDNKLYISTNMGYNYKTNTIINRPYSKNDTNFTGDGKGIIYVLDLNDLNQHYNGNLTAEALNTKLTQTRIILPLKEGEKKGDRSAPKSAFGISYNENKKQFFIGDYDNPLVYVYDETLKTHLGTIKLDTTTPEKNTNIKRRMRQSLYVDSNTIYIMNQYLDPKYYTSSGKTTTKYQNLIHEYDLQGNFIQTINLSNTLKETNRYEIEDMTMYKGKYYTLSNKYSYSNTQNKETSQTDAIISQLNLKQANYSITKNRAPRIYANSKSKNLTLNLQDNNGVDESSIKVQIYDTKKKTYKSLANTDYTIEDDKTNPKTTKNITFPNSEKTFPQNQNIRLRIMANDMTPNIPNKLTSDLQIKNLGMKDQSGNYYTVKLPAYNIESTINESETITNSKTNKITYSTNIFNSKEDAFKNFKITAKADSDETITNIEVKDMYTKESASKNNTISYKIISEKNFTKTTPKEVDVPINLPAKCTSRNGVYRIKVSIKTKNTKRYEIFTISTKSIY